MKSWPYKRDFVKPLSKGQRYNKGTPSYPPKLITPLLPSHKTTKLLKKPNPHKVGLIPNLLPQGAVLSTKDLDTFLRIILIGELSPLSNGRQIRRRRRRRTIVRYV